MNRVKTGSIAAFALIIGIQFIRPQRNRNKNATGKELSHVIPVPDPVGNILKRSCFDCHSNSTNYPWYTEIQPLGWWMSSHIKNGKKELNFSEFGKYSPRRQQSKLKAIGNSVEDNTMPLGSYTLIHKDAVLSTDEMKIIISWAQSAKDSLSQIK